MLADRRRKKGGIGAMRLILAAFLSLAALGSIAAAGAIGALFIVYQGYAEDYVPIEEKLRQTHIGLTTIYDRNGEELGALPNKDAQLLNPVPLEEISHWMVDATVSTEDNSFWDNPGINFRGLARAAYENYVGGGIGSGTGGSSITQQLIKNVYICPNINSPDDPTRCETAERTLDRKLREIVYAIELDKDYPKEKVLGWYLNQVSYADRYIGVQAAAQGYFRKDAKDLSLAESALLAGVVAYPTRYHPRLNCETVAGTDECAVDTDGRTTVVGDAKERQELVLDLMVEHGWATADEAAAARSEVLKVHAAANDVRAAAWIDNQVQPVLERWCEAGKLPKLEAATNCADSVSASGWKVTTTLDYQQTEVAMQQIRGFIETGLTQGCECNNGAIATVDPQTGQIVIYAPNRDPSYTSDPRVAGRIDQLVEINQPGSSFKPAVYLTWFDRNNKAPMSTFWDTSPLTIEGVAITNPRGGGGTEGMISARAALGGSQNVGAFRAAQEAGPDNVIEVAKALGITTLEQHFDPTFYNHDNVTYGASIATGGANIRAIDMAYMNSVFANMGVMVGVPSLAQTVKLSDLEQTDTDSVEDYDEARSQAILFQKGHLRLPGTRELDPVVILKIEDAQGNAVYDHATANDLEKKQVVDGGSVWLLHSIMSDCNARFIIWGCGTSNTDVRLDFHTLEGVKVPSGIKTGTQQGPLSASDTLETWMTGYTRNAATAVWVGNATNELVNDRAFAAANTTVWLWKTWMGTYHSHLLGTGQVGGFEGFDSIRPKNVAQVAFPTVATDRGLGGGCSQTVSGWIRTDVTYASECESREIDTRNGMLASDDTPAQYRETRKFVKLPAFKPELAIALAKARNIPIAPTERSTGQSAIAISSPTNGATLSGKVPVAGSVGAAGVKSWTLELGEGSNPATWTTIGTGTGTVDGVLGTFDTETLTQGVYTVRLTVETSGTGNLVSSVTFNVRKGPGTGTPTAGPGTPTRTPTPGGGGDPGGGGQQTPIPTPTPTRTPRTQVPDTIPNED
ncbi:MAG: penicillin-binding protein [Dehalococcoidia bacterium]|nr:penicillin-binding protein [Dehalococcoidia bacterium]